MPPTAQSSTTCSSASARPASCWRRGRARRGRPRRALRRSSVIALTESGAEAYGEAKGSAPLPQPTPPGEAEAQPEGELGHARGTDPCGYYELKNCENLSGPTIKTTFWFQHKTQEIKCPKGAHPYATDKVTDVTSSEHYAQSVQIIENEAVVELIDYNVTGHPYSYHFYLACSTERQEETVPPGGARPALP